MAAGLPVVSTLHSGIPSLVDDGRTGLLVKPQDDSALADAIDQLATGGQLRLALGAAGRARFEQHFTLPVHIEQMRRVFLEVGKELAPECATSHGGVFAPS
jgi:glycosyltransferase involved in cell wall biosynthesis